MARGEFGFGLWRFFVVKPDGPVVSLHLALSDPVRDALHCLNRETWEILLDQVDFCVRNNLVDDDD